VANECTPRTCGCKARTDEEAVAADMRLLGIGSARGDVEGDATALLYMLREHGWELVKR
jgi:hypothetical protein